jgi:hypothetical protein
LAKLAAEWVPLAVPSLTQRLFETTKNSRFPTCVSSPGNDRPRSSRATVPCTVPSLVQSAPEV